MVVPRIRFSALTSLLTRLLSTTRGGDSVTTLLAMWTRTFVLNVCRNALKVCPFGRLLTGVSLIVLTSFTPWTLTIRGRLVSLRTVPL